MGYVGKLAEKQLAQNLRRQGYSYLKILQIVHVSKGTVSQWCKDIQLSPEQQKALIESKQFGQRKGSIVAAENKRKKREYFEVFLKRKN
jgi:transposase